MPAQLTLKNKENTMNRARADNKRIDFTLPVLTSEDDRGLNLISGFKHDIHPFLTQFPYHS